MSIVSMLEVSTSHITEESNKLLLQSLEESFPLIVYEKSTYGFLIMVTENNDDINHLPQDLIRVINLARRRGCAWIMLDRDGDHEDADLPTYEW
jgi:hypothetical protein